MNHVNRSTRRNIVKCSLFTIFSFLLLLFYTQRHSIVETKEPETPVILYTNTYEMEKNLPQHNLDLPFPEGRTGRYVRFSTQAGQLGWNNVFNEILLCSHLAWRSKRSYVFQNYRWKVEHFPFKVDYNPETPLNALISGPIAGGPFPASDPSPRAISNVWFNQACPENEVVRLEAARTKDPVRWDDGDKIMEHWVKVLSEHPARCIDVVDSPGSGDGFPQTFDLWLVSTPRVLPLWDEFKNSPISRLLHSSPLVNRAIMANEQFFFPLNTRSAISRYNSMMTLHLRRGDFEGACQHFANWNSTFFMWNLLPGLPDALHPEHPTGKEDTANGENTPGNYRMFKRRCMPTDEEIVIKILESKLDWETDIGKGVAATDGGAAVRPREQLSTLYILTNGEKEWVEGFKRRMLEEGWTTIITSSDLKLDNEQTSVSVAIDMEIARRAAVFIGNGWSSMTNNIVYRRLVDGNDYYSSRFF